MYTLILERLAGNGSTCHFGFDYSDFDEAYYVARKWAVEKWGEGNFNEFPSGFFTFENQLIRVLNEEQSTDNICAYTVYMDKLSSASPDDASSCTGPTFQCFDNAYNFAQQWADEDWCKQSINRFPSGFFSSKDELIYVLRTSIADYFIFE